MSRGVHGRLAQTISTLKEVLEAKPILPSIGARWEAEKERNLKEHLLPHSRRIPVSIESLERCTVSFKPQVKGISLFVGDGVSSTSARYFFYEHFCAVRYANPKLKYEVQVGAPQSLVRVHLDRALSQNREHMDIPTSGRMPHQIMDDLCSTFSESGESGTCTQRFEWSTDADSMQSPIETAKQRLANAEAQLSDATPADLRMSATSPLELSELQLDSDDVVNVNTIFKPIDLHGDSRPPPTTAREEFFQKRRRETLERKNKRLLTRIKEREEAAKAADKS